MDMFRLQMASNTAAIIARLAASAAVRAACRAVAMSGAAYISQYKTEWQSVDTELTRGGMIAVTQDEIDTARSAAAARAAQFDRPDGVPAQTEARLTQFMSIARDHPSDQRPGSPGSESGYSLNNRSLDWAVNEQNLDGFPSPPQRVRRRATGPRGVHLALMCLFTCVSPASASPTSAIAATIRYAVRAHPMAMIGVIAIAILLVILNACHRAIAIRDATPDTEGTDHVCASAPVWW
jgi:hypothetical protein